MLRAVDDIFLILLRTPHLDMIHDKARRKSRSMRVGNNPRSEWKLCSRRRLFSSKKKDLVYYSPIIATFFGLTPSMAPSTLGGSSRGDRFYRTTLSFSRNWFCDHETITARNNIRFNVIRIYDNQFLALLLQCLDYLGWLLWTLFTKRGRPTVLELGWMWQDAGEHFNIQHSWCIKIHLIVL
jgi:hypothetical protein